MKGLITENNLCILMIKIKILKKFLKLDKHLYVKFVFKKIILLLWTKKNNVL